LLRAGEWSLCLGASRDIADPGERSRCGRLTSALKSAILSSAHRAPPVRGED
jgi:hypothetical protein